MSTAIVNTPLIGSQIVGNGYLPDTTQRHALGTIVEANDPFYGGGEYIYLKSGQTDILNISHLLCTWDNDFIATSATVAANQGRPCAVSNVPNILNGFAWYQIAGQSPVKASTSFNGTPAFTSAANAGTVTNSGAGREILGMLSVGDSTTTIVKTANTRSGSTVLKVSDTNGWIVGLFLSGTGIPGGTVISRIDADNNLVVMNNSATATGDATVTATFTGYVLIEYDRPYLQGQIT